jgi:hypothetical protein
MSAPEHVSEWAATVAQVVPLLALLVLVETRTLSFAMPPRWNRSIGGRSLILYLALCFIVPTMLVEWAAIRAVREPDWLSAPYQWLIDLWLVVLIVYSGMGLVTSVILQVVQRDASEGADDRDAGIQSSTPMAVRPGGQVTSSDAIRTRVGTGNLEGLEHDTRGGTRSLGPRQVLLLLVVGFVAWLVGRVSRRRT